MASESQDRAGWLARVLGVRIEQHDEAFDAAGFEAAVSLLQDAQSRVDQQVTSLQSAIREQGIAELDAIADSGLNAITGGFKVRVAAGIIKARSGKATDRTNLSRLAGGFMDHLRTDSRIAACDNNPFNVRMSVRDTLIPALRSLQEAVA